jgi:Sel1 repeat-containing protein
MFSIPKDQVRWIEQDRFESDFQGFIQELKDWVVARCYQTKKVDKQVECERGLRLQMRQEGWQQVAPVVAKRKLAQREEYEIGRDVTCALHKGSWAKELAAALSAAVPNEASAAAARKLAEAAGLCHEDALRLNTIRSLAERGDARSQAILGITHWYRGKHVDQDKAKGAKNLVESLRWLQQAAEQGDGEAQEFLAMSNLDGDGVAQDYVQAYTWFTLAIPRREKSDQGSLRGVLDELAHKMTQTQIAEAQRLARDWKPKREDHLCSAFDCRFFVPPPANR